MALHPLHNHPLKEVQDTKSLYPEFNGQWQCDNCEESFDSTHHPYHCSVCQFDLCTRNCLQPRTHIRHIPFHKLYWSNMKKLYEQYGGRWKCDGCREVKDPSNEPLAFHCFNDDFDLCLQCFNGRQFDIHIHPLKPADATYVYENSPGLWRCDGCKRHGTPDIGTMYSWHCEECEFDACERCLKPIDSSRHVHPLKLADPRKIYPEANCSWFCDRCATNYHYDPNSPDAQLPYHCFTCGDYDLCTRCQGALQNDNGYDVAGPPIEAFMHLMQRDIPQTNKVHEPPIEMMDDDDTPVEGLDDSQRCIVCVNKPKNATIVHGNTGHVCCCLSCAYTLQKRGDSCPICRAPIDRVIKHFTS